MRDKTENIHRQNQIKPVASDDTLRSSDTKQSVCDKQYFRHAPDVVNTRGSEVKKI